MAFSSAKTFTTDHTQCGSSSTNNFVVCVCVTDPDFRSKAFGGYVQSTNGYDIRPYFDSALNSPLDFELVPGTYNPATGFVMMFANIGLLDAANDVTYYMAFGNPAITTDGTSTAPWNHNNRIGVWHFPSISDLLDSTPNANNGTNHSCTNRSDFLGGAINAATGQYVDLPHSQLDVAFNTLSVELWGNVTSTANNPLQGVIKLGAWFLGYQDTGGGYLPTYSTSTSITGVNTCQGTTVLSTGSWHYLAGSYDNNGNDQEVFFDGAQQHSIFANGTIAANGNFLQAGGDQGGSTGWNGGLAELRITGGQLTTDETIPTYNNMKAGSTFLKWGTRVSLSTPWLSPQGLLMNAPGMIAPSGYQPPSH